MYQTGLETVFKNVSNFAWNVHKWMKSLLVYLSTNQDVISLELHFFWITRDTYLIQGIPLVEWSKSMETRHLMQHLNWQSNNKESIKRTVPTSGVWQPGPTTITQTGVLEINPVPHRYTYTYQPVVIGGTGGPRNDNLLCHEWQMAKVAS